MKSKREGRQIPRKIILVTAVFCLVISFIGIIMTGKLKKLFIQYIEDRVAEEADIMAQTAEEKFENEFQELRQIAYILQKEKISVNNVPGLNLAGGKTGVLDIDGKAMSGDEISMAEYPGIRESFRGNESVCYNDNGGILFSVPVYSGENIKYIVYKLYAKSELRDKFALDCCDGRGGVLITDKEVTVVPVSNSKYSEDFWASGEVIKVISDINSRLNIYTSAAGYCEYGEKVFLFMAEIGYTKMYIMGAIPASYMYEGLSYILTLVVWVFGLLMVMLVIAMIYLFGTDKKARERDEFRKAKIAAEEASRYMSEFLAKVSHEVRTPINAVLGMDEMILRESRNRDIKKYAVDIQTAARSLHSIFNEILDSSKIQSGRMEIVPVEYNLGIMLNELVSMVSVRAAEKDLELVVDVDDSMPSVLKGDDLRIKQVAVNLLTNAVKYTHNGKVTLKVDGVKKDDGIFVMHMEVKDTGIGIREEEIPKIFMPYQRIDLEKNHSIEGTGLGMGITVQLLRLMDSELHVESEYGVGSTFYFDLKQVIIDDTPMGKLELIADKRADEYNYEALFAAPDAKVLVVDDNEINRKVIKNLLKETGIQVFEANSGTECIELVKTNRYDVILLDHMMPGLDGVETLRVLRNMDDNLFRGVPIIMMTANSISGARDDYLNLGFDDYLSKPIDAKRLEKLLLKFLPDRLITKNLPQINSGKQTTLPDIDGIDWRYARIFVDDDNMIRMTALDLYDTLDEEIEGLNKRLESVDTEDGMMDYRIQVHSLKGISQTIGAVLAFSLARVTEKAAIAGDAERVRRLHSELIAELNRLHDAMAVLKNDSQY